MAPTVAVCTADSSCLLLKAVPVRRSLVFRPVTKHLAPVARRSSLGTSTSAPLPRSASVVPHAKKAGGKGGKGREAREAVSEDSDDAPASKGGKGSRGGKGGSRDRDSEGAGSSSSGSAPAADFAKLEKEVKADLDARMKKAVTVLSDNFNTVRTGRANPAMLDRVMVDCHGIPTPLKQLGGISVPDSATLLVTPFEKSALKDIERALTESDLGITPSNDGQRIRLSMPAPTQERRKELARVVSKFGEDCKVALRNVRRDVMKRMDKVDLPKDSKKDLEDDVQKLTDSFVKKVDDMVKTKTDEVLKL